MYRNFYILEQYLNTHNKNYHRVQLSEGHLPDALTVLGPISSSEKGKLRNLKEPERKVTKSVVC